MTQLDLHFETKADGTVQFITAAGLFWNNSYLKIFFKREGMLGRVLAFSVCKTVNNNICTLRYKGSAIMRNCFLPDWHT